MFVKFSPGKSGDGCLFVPVRSCDDQLLPTVCSLRNQFVAGTLLVLACRLSTRSTGVSYSLVPFVLAPALHNTPASFLQTTMAQLHRQQDHRQGCRHKDTRTMQTHTRWNAQRPQTRTDFPKVCSKLQNNPDDTISPHAARLIYPITFLITGWLYSNDQPVSPRQTAHW